MRIKLQIQQKLFNKVEKKFDDAILHAKTMNFLIIYKSF